MNNKNNTFLPGADYKLACFLPPGLAGTSPLTCLHAAPGAGGGAGVTVVAVVCGVTVPLRVYQSTSRSLECIISSPSQV